MKIILSLAVVRWSASRFWQSLFDSFSTHPFSRHSNPSAINHRIKNKRLINEQLCRNSNSRRPRSRWVTLSAGLIRSSSCRADAIRGNGVQFARTNRKRAYVNKGLIAADPRFLPLGSRVRLDAGPYSGEYLVADTGTLVKGRRIDIWTPTSREAMSFGRRTVKLTVLSYGGKREQHTRAQ